MTKNAVSEKNEGQRCESPKGASAHIERNQGSRSNAIKHGLTAKTLFPNTLQDREFLVEHHARLVKFWNPQTPTDHFFVRELARHETALQKAEEMEAAILRHSGKKASSIVFADQAEQYSDEEMADALLATAGASDALVRITRYRRAHERGFHKCLNALRQNDDSTVNDIDRETSDERRSFATDAECEAYLLARIADSGYCCKKCQGSSGNWVASRRVWQCRSCRRQNSIRVGTVMERSHLPLHVWFGAIQALLRDRDCSNAKLVEITEINRTATVRRIARRIRSAIDSPNASKLLAGLDRVLGEN
jgi:hypothetical protein